MKFLMAALIGLFAAIPCFAQVQASGTGTVYAKPDCAHADFWVTTKHKTAATAHADNRINSDALFATIKKHKIDDADVRTTYFGVNTVYDDKGGFSHFSVTHRIDCKVRKLADLGALIDGAVSDSTRLAGISFNVSNQDELENKARDLALADAKRKANQMVTGLDSHLGKLISVSEGSGYSPQLYMTVAADKVNPVGAPSQLMAGQQAITVIVNATWDVRPAGCP